MTNNVIMTGLELVEGRNCLVDHPHHLKGNKHWFKYLVVNSDMHLLLQKPKLIFLFLFFQIKSNLLQKRENKYYKYYFFGYKMEFFLPKQF